jgi:FAD/FMN-containing dehydrogenase
MANLENKFHEIFGPENVTDRQEDVGRYASDQSIFSGVTPSFVVRPSDAAEVRSLVRLANKEKIPLIPVSSGIHFNGITLPTQGGVIVDLGRMDRIIEVDIRNRRAMIEPGVRWGQLQDHLKGMDMVAMNPLFPHPLQSVVTSYLERHPLLIPKFEYAEPIYTLEVILPSGDLLRTGSAASPGAPNDTIADMVCPYGPGLDFFRLFQGAQGTLGIITWVNIKIEYFSPLRKTYYIQSNHLSRLLSLVHSVQRLMIGNECFILERPDMACIASQGDRKTMEDITAGIKNWTAVIQMAGTRWRPEEKIAYQDKAFHEICRDHQMAPQDSLTESGLESGLFENGLQRPWVEDQIYWKHLMNGQCHDVAFHTTFGRLPQIIQEVVSFLSEKGIEERNYSLYIQPLEYGRAYYCRLHLYYDPEHGDHEEKMGELDNSLNRLLFLSGVLFNTPYGSQAELTYDHATMYTATLKKIKSIFDPKGVMNPGRLCF